MTLTYGFYDSSSSDRVYNAKQFGSIFDGIIEDGVYAGIGGKLMVTEDSPVSMDVIVGDGRAWFDHTWTLNDAALTKTIATADALLNRIDVVYLEVNESTRTNSIAVLTGTPASTPVAPTLTQTSTVHQYPLAHVYVGAAVTSITQANITNKVGTTATPFVAGIIDYVTTNEILAQWEAEWEQWFNDIKDQLSTEAETNLQNQIWDLAGVGSGAPPYADDMVTLSTHDHSNGNHPQIPTAGIENLAVTAAKIANGAVTGTQIASLAISEAKIASYAVTQAKLGTGAVGSSQLANDAVISSKIADGAIDNAAYIANNLITEQHVGWKLPALMTRFGGSSSSWNTPGTTSYTVGNVRMQAGVISVSAMGQAQIVYSPAFSYAPILFINEDTPDFDTNGDMQISYPPGYAGFQEGFKIAELSNRARTFQWLAIGPE